MNKSEDLVQALSQQILDERKSVAAETQAAKQRSMLEVIGNGIYGPLKAGLDNLQNQPGSKVTVTELNYSEFLLGSDTVCAIETNLSYQKSSGAALEDDDDYYSDKNDTVDIYFSSSGITVPSLFSYRNEVPYEQVDVPKVLAHFFDEALNQGFLPVPEHESKTTKPGKAAALVLALGIGLPVLVHSIFNNIQGDKKTDQAIADGITAIQPQHTRSADRDLYLEGQKQSKFGSLERDILFVALGSSYLLKKKLDRKTDKAPAPGITG